MNMVYREPGVSPGLDLNDHIARRRFQETQEPHYDESAHRKLLRAKLGLHDALRGIEATMASGGLLESERKVIADAGVFLLGRIRDLDERIEHLRFEHERAIVR